MTLLTTLTSHTLSAPRHSRDFVEVNSEKLPSIVWVQTDSADSESEVDDLFGGYVEQGYEGGIIRLNGVYEQKRSNNLLKRKDFEDAEFEIISVEEGQGNWSVAMLRHCSLNCLTALYNNPD